MLCTCSGAYAESQTLAPVIDSSVYPSGSNSSSASTNSLYEMFGRLEQMQSEIQQLRGVVEEQSYTIVELKKRQSNIYSDLDTRLQVLSGGDIQENSIPALNNPGDRRQTAAPPVVIPKRDLYADEKIPGSVTESTPTALVIDQSALYQKAYDTLRNGHNTRAISKFKALLTEFPEGDYAANSQYWLGEAYRVNKDTALAKKAFTTLVSQYGTSLKVPDALFKLGDIEFEQGNVAKARDYLTKVKVSYPNSTAAHLATKKLGRIRATRP